MQAALDEGGRKESPPPGIRPSLVAGTTPGLSHVILRHSGATLMVALYIAALAVWALRGFTDRQPLSPARPALSRLQADREAA